MQLDFQALFHQEKQCFLLAASTQLGLLKPCYYCPVYAEGTCQDQD